MASFSRHRVVASLMIALMVLMAASPLVSAQTPVGTAAGTPATTVPPIYRKTPCAAPLPAPLVDGKSAECGTVTAPLYYDRESVETVKLRVIRIWSAASAPAAEPLFILTGGPGESLDAVLPLFSDASPIYRPLLARQSVILFDQRGMGSSTPSLACPFEALGAATPVAATPIGTPAATDLGLGAQLQPLLDCGKALVDSGIDPSAFTTLSNASDVNSIRVALGDKQIDLFGISYGTDLALTVMRDFPSIVHTAILDSTLPPQENLLVSQLTGFDTALKHIFAGCAADPVCAAANPNLEQSIEKGVAQLEASPKTFTVKDPTTGAPTPVTVDGSTYLTLIYTGIFIGQGVPFMPGIITATANGDTGPLERALPVLLIPTPTSAGALLTYVCQDDYPYTSKDAVVKALADEDALPVLQDGNFGGATALAFAVCPTWGFPAAPEAVNAPAASDAPTLLVAGEYDPITPPDFAARAAASLPNSTVIVVPGLGHDPVTFGGACTVGIVAAFLNDPAAPVDSSCTASLAVDFSPDQATPAESPEASPVS